MFITGFSLLYSYQLVNVIRLIFVSWLIILLLFDVVLYICMSVCMYMYIFVHGMPPSFEVGGGTGW